MYYGEIKNCDIANGPGVRVSLFVSGCTHHCPGCFNEVAWDFGYGEPFTQQTIDTILDMLRPDYIRGLTLLGGEPFEPEIRDGHIWARGADDDKGQSFIQVKAFEYLVKNGLLKNNVTVSYTHLTLPTT